MHAPQWKVPQGRPEAYPEEWIHASHRSIVGTCLSAGIGYADAEDLAQDIWEWVIRDRIPMSILATPWLYGAVHNYIRRFRRRSFRHRQREGRALESTREPPCRPVLPTLESNDLLNRLGTVLPGRERCLLHLVRRGYSMAEAGRALGIPRGSRAYHQDRLVAYARRAIEWKSGPMARVTRRRPSLRHRKVGSAASPRETDDYAVSVERLEERVSSFTGPKDNVPGRSASSAPEGLSPRSGKSPGVRGRPGRGSPS